jgi:hypothetical protein
MTWISIAAAAAIAVLNAKADRESSEPSIPTTILVNAGREAHAPGKSSETQSAGSGGVLKGASGMGNSKQSDLIPLLSRPQQGILLVAPERRRDTGNFPAGSRPGVVAK